MGKPLKLAWRNPCPSRRSESQQFTTSMAPKSPVKLQPYPDEALQPYQGPERRHWNGTELSQLPLWVRAIAAVGLPSVIAIYLVWVGSNEIPKISRDAMVTQQELAQLKHEMRAHEAGRAELYRLLQKVCA